MSLFTTTTLRRRRRARSVLVPIAAAALGVSGLTAAVTEPANAAPNVGSVNAVGTARLRSNPDGADGLGSPEISPAALGETDGGAAGPPSSGGVARVRSADVKAAGSAVRTSFDGLNLRNQRLANGGNQFTVEPPDQALCVGGGFVVESVNDVLRVFDKSGTPKTGVVDLNTFYNYAPAFVRPAGPFGPFVTDPSCLFDPDTQRFFHTVLTLDTDPATGGFTGSNHIDLAVSQTSDPTGTWTVYRLPVQNDGTEGTPNHGCTDGAGHPGPCIGDYPHLGADANALVVTTNEYELNGPAYISANVYAFSKRALAAGASSVKFVSFDTVGAAAGQPGFTLWPAQAAKGENSDAKGGTEYFLSSDSAAEASGVDPGVTSRRIWAWSLTNTRSLDTSSPSLSLTTRPVAVGAYSPPPKADQKAGDHPLGECINDTTTATPFGPGCWQILFTAEPPHTEVISRPDANDSRMQQVSYADGKLWGALDTAVRVNGEVRAGVEAFVVNPKSGRASSGYLAVGRNNVTYPAVGVTRDGKAVVAMTLLGKDHHPSAAYAALSDSAEFGSVKVIAEGKGVADGFTSYKAFVGDPPRTRWGDYGATAVDGNTVWLASEYVAQSCTLTQYLTTPIGSCGGTRVTLGNWATRVSAVQP